MPELSDGEDEDIEDEQLWQCMDEDDSEPTKVTCLFCDRWDDFQLILQNIFTVRLLFHWLCLFTETSNT